MKLIEHAYPIAFESIDEVIAQARVIFEKEKRHQDQWYAYLSGVLRSAYSGLCMRIEIAHNNRIEERDI